MTPASPAPAGFLFRRKYECLLVALLLHLFAAVVLPDLDVYTKVVWPATMAVLGVFSVGIFARLGRAHRHARHALAALAAAVPLALWFVAPSALVMEALSLGYALLFVAMLAEVLRHLLRPSYIDLDIVLASICGFLLILETGIFLMQWLYYSVPGGFRGIDATSFTTVYLDLVYFCAIVLTSIGFGDITPAHHVTKLATSVLGIAGQMYSVILVGILISKYSPATSAADGR